MQHFSVTMIEVATILTNACAYREARSLAQCARVINPLFADCSCDQVVTVPLDRLTSRPPMTRL
eukprot:scaffold498872_cov14-Prasinocladus_malaysianus.AAC.1